MSRRVLVSVLVLVLAAAVAAPAVAGKGDPILIGERNRVQRALTIIQGIGQRPILRIIHGQAGYAIDMRSDGPNFRVSNDQLIADLNADLLDGQDATAFAPSGHDHDTDYLAIDGTAADSDLLDGQDATAFAPSGHDHDTDYLAIDGTAADSDLLDGRDSTAYGRAGHTCPPGETLSGYGRGGPICSSWYGSVVVDGDDQVGRYASMVLGPEGNPVISYYDSTNQHLKLAACGDPACSTVTTRTVDDTPGVGEYTSLVLDAAGNPVISYHDATDDDLELAYCGDPTCATATLRTIDAPLNQFVGRGSSIVLDAAGNPVIAYYSDSNGKLKLAHCDDPTCSSVTITDVHEESPLSVGRRASLVLDAAGNPIISYLEAAPNVNLRLAHCTDPDCATAPTLRVVDDTGDVGGYTSIALDAAGNPIISYRDITNEDLKVAHCDDPTCASATLTTVDGPDAVGSDTSMVLDALGNPVISYYDATNGDLKLALCGSPDCSIATVATVDGGPDDVGTFTSVALDPAGNPVIAYFDDTNDDLRVAVLIR